jgi:hypothetical protein
MRTSEHQQHIDSRMSHNNCPECRADNSRWHAQHKAFSHADVPTEARHSYIAWIRPRLEAIRTGNQTLEARRWQRDFLDALHSRISSHITETGRKFAPEYTRYHLATYGNDWHYLNS